MLRKWPEAGLTVHVAAKVLDKEIPSWWEWVDVNTLRMNDVCNCVVGKLVHHVAATRPYGPHYGYVTLLNRLAAAGAPPSAFGGNACLGPLWVEEIEQRKKALAEVLPEPELVEA